MGPAALGVLAVMMGFLAGNLGARASSDNPSSAWPVAAATAATALALAAVAIWA